MVARSKWDCWIKRNPFKTRNDPPAYYAICVVFGNDIPKETSGKENREPMRIIEPLARTTTATITIIITIIIIIIIIC